MGEFFNLPNIGGAGREPFERVRAWIAWMLRAIVATMQRDACEASAGHLHLLGKDERRSGRFETRRHTEVALSSPNVMAAGCRHAERWPAPLRNRPEITEYRQG